MKQKTEFVEIGSIIRVEKGKPPKEQPYFGPDAELYLTPEYLRGGATPETAKAGKNALRIGDGDTIVLWDGSNAGEFFWGRDGILPSTMCRLVINGSFEKEYFFYALKMWEQFLKSQTSGSGIPHVDKEILGKIRIIKLSNSEQTKIAEILSTVDSAIKRTEALIAKQQRIKTGLMQDLLTRGIDEHGNIRAEQTHQFKDSPLGRIPAEWEVKQVKETGVVTLGRQLSPKYMAGKFPTPYLRVANVFDGWIDFSDVLEMDFTPSEKEKFFIKSGDILLNEGQSLELVGRSAIYGGPDNMYCYQNTLIRYRASKCALPAYCRSIYKWWLDTGAFQEISRQTTSVAHLGSDRFSKMLLPLPSIGEQYRITDVVHSHEFQLKSHMEICKKLRDMKNALMQDLLTGEKRVFSQHGKGGS